MAIPNFGYTPFGGAGLTPFQGQQPAPSLPQLGQLQSTVQGLKPTFAPAPPPALPGFFNKQGNATGQLEAPPLPATPVPGITTGPVWGQQQIDQQVNQAKASAEQRFATQQRVLDAARAARGFSTSDPAAQMQKQADFAKMVADQTTAENQLRFGTAQANAQQQLASQQAAVGAWGTGENVNTARFGQGIEAFNAAIQQQQAQNALALGGAQSELGLQQQQGLQNLGFAQNAYLQAQPLAMQGQGYGLQQFLQGQQIGSQETMQQREFAQQKALQEASLGSAASLQAAQLAAQKQMQQTGITSQETMQQRGLQSQAQLQTQQLDAQRQNLVSQLNVQVQAMGLDFLNSREGRQLQSQIAQLDAHRAILQQYMVNQGSFQNALLGQQGNLIGQQLGIRANQAQDVFNTAAAAAREQAGFNQQDWMSRLNSTLGQANWMQQQPVAQAAQAANMTWQDWANLRNQQQGAVMGDIAAQNAYQRQFPFNKAALQLQQLPFQQPFYGDAQLAKMFPEFTKLVANAFPVNTGTAQERGNYLNWLLNFMGTMGSQFNTNLPNVAPQLPPAGQGGAPAPKA